MPTFTPSDEVELEGFIRAIEEIKWLCAQREAGLHGHHSTSLTAEVQIVNCPKGNGNRVQGEVRMWREGNGHTNVVQRVTYVISWSKFSSFRGAPGWSNTGIETPHIKQEVEL